MSTDLLNQLEAYYTEIEVTHHDVTPDRVADLVERVREVPAPRFIPLQEKPRVWVPVAAATALIVLIAVVPVVFRILADDAPPTTDPTPTTTVAPTTTSTPEAAPSTTVAAPAVDPSTPPTVEWTELAFEFGAGPMSGRAHGYANVHATDDGFAILQPAFEEWDSVAGQMIDLNGDTRDIIWTSSDGLAWTAREVVRPIPDEALAASSLVGVIRDTYLMNFYPKPDSGVDGCVPCASDDLSTWKRLDGWPYGSTPVVAGETVVDVWGTDVYVSDLGFTKIQVVDPFSATATDAIGSTHLVATSDRFYAVMYEYTPTIEGGSPDGPIGSVWSSSDGLEWTAELVLKNTGIRAIAANRDRVLVAADYGDDTFELWIAESGQPLARIDGPRIPDGEPILVGTDDGFLMGVQYEAVSDPVGMRYAISDLFSTTDGSQWSLTDSPGNLPTRWVRYGSLFLGAESVWAGVYDDEGLIQSGGFDRTGRWILGRTIPPA